MIRVLIADNFPEGRARLSRLLCGDLDIHIVGQAISAAEAVSLTRRLKPDVVVMGELDVARGNPEVSDGLEATRHIMAGTPTPIVATFPPALPDREPRAAALLAAGAIAALTQEPHGSRELVATVKAMAQVKVVGQRLRRARPPRRARDEQKADIIAIAASTGGPHALLQVLKPLPRDLPVPIVIVQHLTSGFVRGFARWLDEQCALEVKLVERTQRLRPGVAYLAPDGAHLCVAKATVAHLHGARGELPFSVYLGDGPPQEGFRPSASVLFDSVAEVFGPRTLAVILTGMGRDGFSGLKRVHAQGGCIIAQDRQTSVVFGMPSMAVEGRLADHVLPVEQIADQMLTLVGSKEPG